MFKFFFLFLILEFSYGILKSCLSSQGFLPCLFCDYHHYNPSITQNLTESLCLQKSSAYENITIKRKILIINASFSDNSFDAIYTSISIGFQQENRILEQYYRSELVIYFSKGNHYYISTEQAIFFRRVKVDLKLMPLYCN